MSLVYAICLNQMAYAKSENTNNSITDEKEVVYNIESDVEKSAISSIESNTKGQLFEIYRVIGEELGVPYTYVKTMHMIAGGKAIYSDKKPNIKNDTTIKGLKAPFDIDGVMQVYDKKAEFIECSDSTIERPSKYYFPDAAYNVMYSIVNIMKNRESVNRGILQQNFDALLPEARQNIIFYESVMEYLGYSEQQVNSIYRVYESILKSKDKNEYVSEIKEDCTYQVKDKFSDILHKNGIDNIEPLAIAFSFDSLLVQGDSNTNIKEYIPLHYKVGYKSRANMILAATSLVGKVRYVWGGGHGGSGNITGISPIWSAFNELYQSKGLNDNCIRPNNTVCPIHGNVGRTSNTCSLSDNIVKTLSDYISLRETDMAGLSNFEQLKTLNWTNVFKNNNLTDIGSNRSYYTQAHRVEGLDCSGFVSWVYNQIDKSRVYDSSAHRFVQSSGLTEVPYGEELLPGDAVAWDTHICMVIGRTDDTNNVYLEVESTPNVVRFGILYYDSATQEQIEYAKNLATEANKLFGNTSENANKKKISSLRGRGLRVGRLSSFEDDDYILPEYNKTFSELNANEILDYTIKFLPIEYISGIDTYDGKLINIASR